MGVFDIDANEIPAIRIAKAVGARVNKRILFVVGGGLGDRVCAEPTIRYFQNQFLECRVSLMCETPEIFSHLRFEKIFTNVDQIPNDEYLALNTYAQGNLANQFFNANLMNPVDFASISALRMTLPLKDKRPFMLFEKIPTLQDPLSQRAVVLHPGKTWPSRTIPSGWWQGVVHSLLAKEYTPVIVGNETVDLDFDLSKCMMLRKELTLKQFAYACQAFPLITNDSSPIHLAAPGWNKVAFVSTVREPSLLSHVRGMNYQFGYNMKNFTDGKPWELFSFCPNDLEHHKIDVFPEGYKIEQFLPDPAEVVEWVVG